MTSNNEQACTSARTMEIDTSTADDTIQAINAQFKKIENLEYFPEKVLLVIFSKVNDADLLHLSDASYRFEQLAKIAFKDKYENNFFVFNGDTDDEREMYEELFSRFGRYADIKAILVYKINVWDPENHWLPQLLRQHTNRINKLTIQVCLVKKLHEFLSEHMNIEHLELIHVLTNADFILPNHRNLKKLTLNHVDGYKFENLSQTIRNNPALESLILKGVTVHGIMKATAENSTSFKHLTELQLESCCGDHRHDSPIADDDMDSIADALKNLQSLKICVCDSQYKLIQRLGVACKSLKLLHLETTFGAISDDKIEALRQFHTIEHFKLEGYRHSVNQIESLVSLVSHWRNLHQLDFQMPIPDTDTNTSILSLLRKCPSIERITFHPINHVKSKIFVDLQFWNEFTEVMQQPDGKIELKFRGQTEGYVTKNEIVWRNTLMHWIGYDWSYNTTDVNLLDLGKKPSIASGVAESKQRIPLDCILDYLDLTSLYSLSATSEQSKQLVENYVERHAKQNGTFIISDEFHCDNANGLDVFAEHVENLRLDIAFMDFFVHLNTVAERYTKLNKLLLRKLSFDSSTRSYYFPHFRVRHLIIINPLFPCDSFDGDFCEYSQLFPDIETLEIQNRLTSHIVNPKPVKFRNLKKFTFKYSSPIVLDRILEKFEKTSAELIPIHTEIE